MLFAPIFVNFSLSGHSNSFILSDNIKYSPYAPCLLGFEGHGGNRTPTIRGIVVHQHNVDMLKEAHREYERHAAEQEQEESQKRILKRWKKLIQGILLKDRLEREYGGDGGDPADV